MTDYSIDDACRDLRPVLDRAPKGAVRGRWTGTTMQAGHAEQQGGYTDQSGARIPTDSSEDFKSIRKIIQRLDEGGSKRFNHVTIGWTKAPLPFMRGTVAIETRFDPEIVPRAPDDPIYEAAAVARRRYWNGLGATEIRVAAERGKANIYGQTKWFGPHRRTLLVQLPDETILVTDGLSTPWAGIPDRENGVECELVLTVSNGTDTAPSAEVVDLWANVLIGISDLAADAYRLLRDVETHGAIVYCRLAEECRPMTQTILSRDGRVIDGLPFGSAPLIRVTPIMAGEIADDDPDDPYGARTAHEALRKRGIEVADARKAR